LNLKRDTIDRLNATEMNGKIFDLKEAHSVGLNA
jgi:hypothetical protein